MTKKRTWCPYYLGQSNGHKLYITCGRDHGSAERLGFESAEDRESFREGFCHGTLKNVCDRARRHDLSTLYTGVIHELKILPMYFNDVVAGVKKFEIRRNDRNFKVGDTVILKEWDDDYTGRTATTRITYLLDDGPVKIDGHVMFGIEPKCRECGCTRDNPCEGGCYWVEFDLCSKCSAEEQQKLGELKEILTAGEAV